MVYFHSPASTGVPGQLRGNELAAARRLIAKRIEKRQKEDKSIWSAGPSAFLRSFADLLRGKFKPHEYDKIVLPFTRFLPFNQGYDHAASNPASATGQATAYPWE